MPQPYREQVSNVAALPVPKAGPALDVVARPVSTFEGAQVDPLTMLGKSLEGFVNPVAQYSVEKDKQDKHIADIEAKAKVATESADKLRAGLVPTDNPNVPAALAPYYLDKLKEASAERLALQSRDLYLSQFSQEYKKPDFNLSEFDAKFRATELAGLTEPHMVGTIGSALDNARGHAQAEYRSFALQRSTEESQSLYSAGLAEIGPSVSPETGFHIWKKAADEYVGRGGTRAEAAKFLLDHVNSISAKWPSPELYELFNQTDPTTGRTIAEMNPGLKDAIANAQKAAEQAQDHAFIKGTMATYEDRKATLDRNLMSGAYASWSPDQLRAEFLPEVSPTGLFRDKGEYSSFVNKVEIQRQELIAKAGRLEKIKSGQAWTLGKDVQTKELNEAAGPLVNALSSTIDDPAKADESRQLMRALQNMVVDYKFDVAHDGLKALVGSVKAAVPKTGEAPSPRFQRLAELYAGFKGSNNPQALSMYFDQDTKDLFETYNHLTVNGSVSSPTALLQAYRMADPAVRAAAEEAMKKPEVNAKIRSEATTTVTSLGRRLYNAVTPDWLGTRLGSLVGNPYAGVAPDTGVLEREAFEEAKRFIAISGTTDPALVAKVVERYTAENFYHDPASNSIVKIPPALNSQATQEGITAYMEMVRNTWGADSNPRLIHMGGDTYRVQLTQPREHVLADVSLNGIVQIHKAKISMSPNELQGLGDLNKKAIDGTLTQQDYTDNEQLIAKATSLSMLPSALTKGVATVREKSLIPVAPEIDAMMKRAAETGSVRLKPVAPGNAETGALVKRFVASKDYGAALTTMGEEVRLTAYKDKAGKSTIGIGYNMDDNAQYLPEDFRKAGIPAESIEAIKAGQMSITPDQAQRLYGAVRPRFEAIAKKVVDKREAGAWDKMASNTKAVLTDMAYQLGGAGLDQYNKGLEQLLKGNLSGSELAVTTLDSKTNVRSTDTRRHNLRKALLSSPTQFEAIVNYAQSKPANQFQYRVAAATQ